MMAMLLAESMLLPPPKPMIILQPLALATAAPSMTWSLMGLAKILLKVTVVICCLASRSWTRFK